jgi:hypothetical protein
MTKISSLIAATNPNELMEFFLMVSERDQMVLK